ncbi:NADPH--cytochrome P450 reductase-like [Mya arenaria]|nr:NADPH--cytochrome P450 reductase-like [Mya arenaria]XP_052801448.1 NADPH--cytochrome P450 reductase-like [Mya arenaria]XP_052801449.1 NADPH--cytochrome P450 reductase-like [Mya arenaria]XP_052801450.1 NADPH--cytochrome P450 reductase-like [Mya arenaria]
MSDESSVPVDGEEAAPFLSNLDFFILSLMAGMAVYWFFFKNKQKEQPTFKKLSVAPLSRSASYDPSFINKMKNSNRNVVVFYGSQTGTGEEFAGRLAKDCAGYGMKGMVADPEECEMEDLSRLTEIDNGLAIFCMATYGEGDPTDNAQEFYEWLQTGDVELNGVKFAVFGLGNKTYEHFNAMGKYVDKRLEELGAERVFEVGSGDDDGNIEEDFVTWREKFWPAVCEHFGVEATGDQVNVRQYTLTEHDDLPAEKVFRGEIARLRSFDNQRPPYDAKNPYLAAVKVNRELHKGGDRSCMHIEFDISGSKIRYEAGDHVAVYPMNDPDSVKAIGKRLGVDLDKIITLTNVDEEASKKHPFPNPCSYRTALLHYMDITSCPRTHILRELAEYAEDEKDKEFLLKLTSATPEGKSLYNEWIIKSHRTILHILEDLPSIAAPIDHICELLPRLQARYYSISSSPKQDPTSIHITAVLVEYETKTNRTIKGVATNWLALMKPAENGAVHRVPIYVRKSQFRLPFKTALPVIMIGPGTGLAPFRGFLQERHYLKTEGKPVGDTILYFGCRKSAEDYIYEDELAEYMKNQTLTKLHLAFSRDQEKKVYVQHLLNQNKEETWKLLEAGGHLYVCGDARNMARDVHDTLMNIIQECGGLDSSRAADYIKKLQNKGRYSCDVWS